MSNKAKKIVNIVVDVVCIIFLVIVLILAISMIQSKVKGYDGYTEFFGKAYLAVKSDSMTGDNEDSFNKGDLIKIRILNGDERNGIEEGTVITFYENKLTDNGKRKINTHRIIKSEQVGSEWKYTTRGDKYTAELGDQAEGNTEYKTESSLSSMVIGVYEGKIGGLGNFVEFMDSSAGFFTFVVLPSLIVVVYFTVNLILVVMKEKKAAKAAAAVDEEQKLADEKERMRAEILAELGVQAPAAENSQQTETAENSAEEVQTEEVQQETAEDGENATEENTDKPANEE